MKNIDARIVTTKRFLKEALLSLLKEEKLSKISIKLLCDRAEINRATFYSHYEDVTQLFNEIIESFMNEISKHINIINNCKDNIQRKETFLNMIKFVDKNSDLFILVYENSNNSSDYSVQYSSLRQNISYKVDSANNGNNYSSYITNFFFYGGGSILYTWIKNGKKESREELASIMFILLTKGYSFFVSDEN